ncbi:fatty acid--CoA ligase family protein [Streptomyces sp. Li-HN-5-11]|uniref:class I adenylate-forming enzyme family protein n=1 Tax=Streptomyces sp. Li-HN-5-11 TaxID=3075432 RepID=UPI0028A72E80|nr:fatty acid--CoA ligase family protein [Streptomyces sp. Li-HN-5-11]WNM34716.1 fatty acid--CoA ligase family protein [Streptomyces sp. Li-HN-5-11]
MSTRREANSHTAQTRHYVLRILEGLERDPARIAVHSRDGDLTAAGLLGSVSHAAASLTRAGTGRGDTVALLTEPNCATMLAARYAAHLLGAAVIHIRSMNARSDAEELPAGEQARLLRATGARVLVVDGPNVARGRALQEVHDGLALVPLTRDDSARATGDLPPAAPCGPQDLAVVDLTSGTTGRPKLVRRSFGVRDRLIDLSFGLPAPEHRPTLLSVTPISHTTATMVDAALTAGGTVVLHNGFRPDDVLNALTEQQVTDVYLAVPHLYQLISRPGIDEAVFPSLRQVLYSGTAAAPSRVARAARVFGNTLAQLYGSTEAGGICTLTPLDHAEPELLSSVGRPFPWVETEIRHPESDEAVERGEPGEICVRSPTTMDGYLGEEDLSAAVKRDGWLRTGDLGRWDKYGYLHLLGRVGGVVKANGIKIHPTSVQDVILQHPDVADAVVYGTRDTAYTEHLGAAVQLRTGARCTGDDLRTHIAASLSAAHVPERFSWWKEIPLSPSGKPDYARIRDGKDA